MKSRPAAVLALKPDPPALQFHKAARDVQTEAHARNFPRPSGLRNGRTSEKRAGPRRAECRCHCRGPTCARPVRAPSGIPRVGGCLRPDDQDAAFGRVLVRVADQVGEHLAEPGLIAPYSRKGRRQLHAEPSASCRLSAACWIAGFQPTRPSSSTVRKSSRSWPASILELSFKSDTSVDMRSVLDRMVSRKFACISVIGPTLPAASISA